MSELTPLDPDQVTCPRCGAAPLVVCRQPDGNRAKSIHVARRRAAERGEVEPSTLATKRVSNPAGPPADARKRGAAASAQARTRRKKEAAAALAAAKEQAEHDAIAAQAETLARDAVRYDRDRAILKRHVLDAASKATTRLIESLDGLQRIEIDDNGRPKTVAEEYEDAQGRPRTRLVPDVRGIYSAGTVERLAKVAASAVNTLRLEEGKPTGITRNEGDGRPVSEVLGEAGVSELLEWAARNDLT